MLFIAIYHMHCIVHCILVVFYALNAMYFIICIVSFALYYKHCITCIISMHFIIFVSMLKTRIIPMWILTTSSNVLENDSSVSMASVNSVQPCAAHYTNKHTNKQIQNENIVTAQLNPNSSWE